MQVDKVRLPDGNVVRPVDWTSTPLYTTVEIAPAANLAELDGYGYGLGGEIPGSFGQVKSKIHDTNLRGQGGQIPVNEELMLYYISLELFVVPQSLANFWAGAETGTPDPPEVSLRNVLRFQQDTMLRLTIAETKKYFDHPVGFFPQAMGVRHTTSAARALNLINGNAQTTAIVGGHHGSPDSFDNRKLSTPKRVFGGQAYVATLHFPTGTVGNLDLGNDSDARLRVRIYSGGLRKRPVA